MMYRQAKLLRKGYAMKIDRYESFPFEEIHDVFAPETHIQDVAKTLDMGVSTLSEFINKKNRAHLPKLIRILNHYGLELILLKDDKYLTDDLDISKMITDKVEISKEVGLSRGYFYVDRGLKYRTDIYLRILDYLGLDLAIMKK